MLLVDHSDLMSWVPKDSKVEVGTVVHDINCMKQAAKPTVDCICGREGKTIASDEFRFKTYEQGQDGLLEACLASGVIQLTNNKVICGWSTVPVVKLVRLAKHNPAKRMSGDTMTASAVKFARLVRHKSGTN